MPGAPTSSESTVPSKGRIVSSGANSGGRGALAAAPCRIFCSARSACRIDDVKDTKPIFGGMQCTLKPAVARTKQPIRRRSLPTRPGGERRRDSAAVRPAQADEAAMEAGRAPLAVAERSLIPARWRPQSHKAHLRRLGTQRPKTLRWRPGAQGRRKMNNGRAVSGRQ